MRTPANLTSEEIKDFSFNIVVDCAKFTGRSVENAAETAAAFAKILERELKHTDLGVIEKAIRAGILAIPNENLYAITAKLLYDFVQKHKSTTSFQIELTKQAPRPPVAIPEASGTTVIKKIILDEYERFHAQRHSKMAGKFYQYDSMSNLGIFSVSEAAKNSAYEYALYLISLENNKKKDKNSISRFLKIDTKKHAIDYAKRLILGRIFTELSKEQIANLFDSRQTFDVPFFDFSQFIDKRTEAQKNYEYTLRQFANFLPERKTFEEKKVLFSQIVLFVQMNNPEKTHEECEKIAAVYCIRQILPEDEFFETLNNILK